MFGEQSQGLLFGPFINNLLHWNNRLCFPLEISDVAKEKTSCALLVCCGHGVTNTALPAVSAPCMRHCT